MKVKGPKAYCNSDGSLKGLIETRDIYEKLKQGKVDWKDHIKNKMTQVTIPWDLFCVLMEQDKQLDKELDQCPTEENNYGKDDLNPCDFEPIEKYTNCTVIIKKCSECGATEIEWEPTADTVKNGFTKYVPDEELDDVWGTNDWPKHNPNIPTNMP